MEAAAPLQHIPGEHNGNAILRLVKQEPHMISLKAGDTLVGLSVTLPGLLSPPAGGTGTAGTPPAHPCPGEDRAATAIPRGTLDPLAGGR